MNLVETKAPHLVGAAAALAVCMLAFPTEGAAEISHDALWGTPSDSCASSEQVNRNGFASFVAEADRSLRRARSRLRTSLRRVSRSEDRGANEPSKGPCSSQADDSKAALNLCLEATGAPASAAPTLLTNSHPFEVSRRVVTPGIPSLALRDGAPRSVPLADVPELPNRSNPDASCTTNAPEDCRGLPPRPGQLDAEAPAVPPNLRAAEMDTPDRPERDRLPAPDRRTLELSDGYDSPPDKPPRIRMRSG